MKEVNLLETDELTLFEKMVLSKLASIDASLGKVSLRLYKVVQRLDKLLSYEETIYENARQNIIDRNEEEFYKLRNLRWEIEEPDQKT